MRRVVTTLALTLILSGCSMSAGVPVGLLTGIESCYAGGQSPSYQGVLVPDPEYGTRIEGKGPVMWTKGYTGRRLIFSGAVEVLDRDGNIVATTGKAYAIAPAPGPGGEAGQLMEQTGAIGAPDCYSWDFVDCSPTTSDPDAEQWCPRQG